MTPPQDEEELARKRRHMFTTVKQAMFTSRTAPAAATERAQQVRDLMFDKNTKAMAAAYNVAPRTVQRWMAGERTPRGEDAARLHRDALAVQTTKTGRKRRANQLRAKASNSGYNAHISRAGTFNIRGSDAVRPQDLDLQLTGAQAAVIAEAEDDEAIQKIIGEAIADYFNGGSVYSGFHWDDFDFDVESFRLD